MFQREEIGIHAMQYDFRSHYAHSSCIYKVTKQANVGILQSQRN